MLSKDGTIKFVNEQDAWKNTLWAFAKDTMFG